MNVIAQFRCNRCGKVEKKIAEKEFSTDSAARKWLMAAMDGLWKEHQPKCPLKGGIIAE